MEIRRPGRPRNKAETPVDQPAADEGVQAMKIPESIDVPKATNAPIRRRLTDEGWELY